MPVTVGADESPKTRATKARPPSEETELSSESVSESESSLITGRTVPFFPAESVVRDLFVTELGPA